MQIVFGLAPDPALHGCQFVSVFADHGLQFGESAANGCFCFRRFVFLFYCSLARGKLHLNGVFTVSADITHCLPFKAGCFVYAEISIAHIAVCSRGVSVEIGFKGSVQKLINFIRRIRPPG